MYTKQLQHNVHQRSAQANDSTMTHPMHSLDAPGAFFFVSLRKYTEHPVVGCDIGSLEPTIQAGFLTYKVSCSCSLPRKCIFQWLPYIAIQSELHGMQQEQTSITAMTGL